ncbi:MAG TPA: CHAT domain-containing protein [Terriglobia bacterium]|nr:CHAT domain-containing protein [Terriglobia bacterium]
MRFRISTKKQEDGWSAELSQPDAPEIAPVGRRLRKSVPGGLPLPPVGESNDWAPLHATLSAGPGDDEIRALHRKIVRADPPPDADDMKKLGGYLFSTVVGSFWGEIEKSGDCRIELFFESNDRIMHRLPWEMMHGPNGFLAADEKRRIAIARLVDASPLDHEPLEIPLRVLFVVGRQMDDALRPGAEYLGLLRQLQVPIPAGAATVQGVGVHMRLLMGASTESIEAAIQAFEPAIVHFVCHGRVENDGPVILLTHRDAASGQRVDDEDPCKPARLLEVLKYRDKVPAVVVLNACHTGERNDAHLAFAAALVTGGIPLAVGMSGEAADAACRIFARTFYSALLKNQDVLAASALGRRAAMLHYKNFLTSTEWLRPAIYLSKAGAPALHLNPSRSALAVTAAGYRLRKEHELLCDRIASMKQYQVFEGAMAGTKAILAFEVGLDEGSKDQLGKTWLLDEISGHAVLDGFIPCILRSGTAFDPPSNMVAFALKLADAMDASRTKFGLKKRVLSQALELALAILGDNSKLDPAEPAKLIAKRFEIDKKLKQEGDEFNPGVGAVLEADIAVLVNDIKKDIPEIRGVMVLIDDLHRYVGVSTNVLKTLWEEAPCPLVFTYSSKIKAGPDISKFLSEHSSGVYKEMLLPFQRPTESRLAYGQYLMSQTPPLSPTWQMDKNEFVSTFFDSMHDVVQGIPSRLDNFMGQIKFSRDLKLLIESDDEAILKKRLELDGAD